MIWEDIAAYIFAGISVICTLLALSMDFLTTYYIKYVKKYKCAVCGVKKTSYHMMYNWLKQSEGPLCTHLCARVYYHNRNVEYLRLLESDEFIGLSPMKIIDARHTVEDYPFNECLFIFDKKEIQ